MEWNEILKYVQKNVKHFEFKHNNTVIRLMADFVIINDVLTINDVIEIHVVKDKTIWFNEQIHIDSDDIKDIWIH